MRRLVVALVVFAAACSSGDGKARDTVAPSTSAVPDGATRTIKVDGRARTYLVHRPTSIDPDDGTSLVVVLHGGFGTAAQARQSYGWDAKADAEGFVVVYPNGIDKAWNAGTCCGRPQREGIDDVKFLGAVIDEVTKTEKHRPGPRVRDRHLERRDDGLSPGVRAAGQGGRHRARSPRA